MVPSVLVFHSVNAFTSRLVVHCQQISPYAHAMLGVDVTLGVGGTLGGVGAGVLVGESVVRT